MIEPRPVAPLPRPAPAASPGPLDDDFYDLVETRFVRLIRDNPVLGTALGLHQDDDLLGDGSQRGRPRRAGRGSRAPRRGRGDRPGRRCPPRPASSASSRSTTSAGPSSTRTSSASGSVARSHSIIVGDGLFLLFARDHAPLPERLDAIAGRLEAIATYLEESKTRATVPQVRLWQRIEIETAGELPTFFDELVAAGVDVLPAAEQRRLERASESAKIAVELYAAWLEGTLAERHRRLGDRAREARRDGRPARVRRPRRGRDPRARLGAARGGTCGTGRGRPRDRRRRRRDDRHRPGQVRPAGRLRGRARGVPGRDAPRAPPPRRARPRDGPRRRADRCRADARVPAQRRSVRGLLRTGRLRPRPEGHLHRHPVGRRRPERDARAQLLVDQQHQHPRGVPGPPPPARHRSPEGVADAAPGRRARVRRGLGDVLGADDARARLRRRPGLPRDHAHRRDLAGLPDHPRHPVAPRRDRRRGGDRLPRRADELRAAQRRAEVQWYTYRPTYPLSYLLGRTLLLGLRADEQARLGDRFSLKGFHDTLLRNGSLPISFHRRLLAAGA